MKTITGIIFLFICGLIYAQPDTVNTGSSANDGTGDPLRTAFGKLNTNDKAAFDSITELRNGISNVSTEVGVVDTKYSGVTGFIIDSIAYTEDTLYARYNAEVIKILLSGFAAVPPPDPSTSMPMTMDQYYVSHPNVANNDDIGYVHVMPVDTIFNNHSSYTYSIISGNTGTAYKINSSSGLLEVNDYTQISDDFTLGVKIEADNGDLDTATCYVYYRSGTEGTVLVYVDPDDSGSANEGTFAEPYNTLAPVNDYGAFDDGMTVLIKRGTRVEPDGWNIDNQGNRIYLAAYGSGDKPVLYNDGSDERALQLGYTTPAPPQADGVNDCDSLTIMDIRIVGPGTDGSDQYDEAIRVWENSQHLRFYRLEIDSLQSGQGAVYVRGDDAEQKDLIVQNCSFTNIDAGIASNYDRALKSEGHGVYVWACTFDNNEYTNIMMGQYNQETWGEVKYSYFYGERTTFPSAPLQFRAPGIDVEWCFISNFYYGLEFTNYDFFGSVPSVWDASIKNTLIEGVQYGTRFYNTETATSEKYDTIAFENVAIIGATSYGFRFDDNSSADLDFDHITLKNCISVDAPYNLYVNGGLQNTISVQNSIFYGASSTDVYTSAAISTSTFRNNIFGSISNVPHWNTYVTNYDIGAASPFVGSGDYQTKAGWYDIIDAGTDISNTHDILGNEVGTQDKGCFEYNGTQFNWTNR